ncbi:MAG: TonB-dependent receptor plug domain-containing protein [Chlorobi bacterium]|nr:TonB-dependent receptor plug domain-containing protein [Chlorobiota bacterium]
MKQFLILFTGLVLSVSVLAQNKVVRGKLTVFKTYPVQHVLVTAKKAKTSVTTDSLGQFSIVCFDNDVIKIKPKTFQPVSKRVGPDTDSLTINLIFIDNPTNRKRAVGYGYINKDNLLYAVDHLDQENNDFCNYTDIFDLIKGRFSGVIVASGKVYIRGSNSFSGQSQAIYIVNGVETQTIDWISPCQIKTIDVLKDSNAAIYGSRGGNGVIIIQTKKR